MELSAPLMLAAMVLIGAGFTMRHTRFGKTGIMVLAGPSCWASAPSSCALSRRFWAKAGSCRWRLSPGPRDCGRSCCAGAFAAYRGWMRTRRPPYDRRGPVRAAACPARRRAGCNRSRLRTLIADTIRFAQGEQVIRAEGSVEIFYQGARLRAASVVYDGASDRVEVTGPISLTEETGRTIIFAEFAELSADLQEGVLRSRAAGARPAAPDRGEPRSNARTGATRQLLPGRRLGVRVLFRQPVPLWEIRARRG